MSGKGKFALKAIPLGISFFVLLEAVLYLWMAFWICTKIFFW